MRLKEFRILNKWKLEQVAEMLRERGVSAANGSVVHRHETGRRFPEHVAIDAYRDISDGAVTYDDHAAVHKEWLKTPTAQAEKKRQAELKAIKALKAANADQVSA